MNHNIVHFVHNVPNHIIFILLALIFLIHFGTTLSHEPVVILNLQGVSQFF